MERYLKIAKVNLKFNLFPHIIVVIGLCLISPLIMGLKNLDSLNTAKILDMYISLFGMILLVPLFIPDQDKDIRDLVKSKKESITINYLIRIVEAIVCLIIIVLGFLVFLKKGNCTFDFMQYFYGTISTCIFLGGLGILAYSIVDNIAVGYMIPVLYYILCYGAGKKYLGNFYLFSMMEGNVLDKKYLLVAGALMIIVGISYRRKK
ncbi:hypothetical protein [Asaccharospora irregularis]|uniref:ABC-2 family transporter protein n=1 Tax=Asaccharospora irregularis DSM 2635 TaxID=1121321 RepID=A0A1M5PI73_9FIRM|nr:hypothetical protein [Asaccharospora irregularis]SHH01199.1 hypothetical protein SAMN04488530_11440 [Asaccharospora irregularis DSM 2635]